MWTLSISGVHSLKTDPKTHQLGLLKILSLAQKPLKPTSWGVLKTFSELHSSVQVIWAIQKSTLEQV